MVKNPVLRNAPVFILSGGKNSQYYLQPWDLLAYIITRLQPLLLVGHSRGQLLEGPRNLHNNQENRFALLLPHCFFPCLLF